VLLLHDLDADCLHVHQVIRVKDQTPLQHAVPMKKIAQSIPVARPFDGTHREASSGQPLAEAYREQGLRMLSEHATHPAGGYSTEAGILEIWQRMVTGRFKVPLISVSGGKSFRATTGTKTVK
jgi:hypothetical protein